MSFQAMAWAVKQRPGGTKEKFILLMLANYASNEDGDCHPSLTELCDATMLSRDSVIRALKSLEDAGYLSVKRQRVGKVNVANSYCLNLQRVVAQSDQKGSRIERPVVADSTQEGSRNLQGGSRTERLGVVAQSDPNLSVEPINAAQHARENLTDKLLVAAGVRGNPSPNLAFPGDIVGLIQRGYDLDRDILPAIRSKPNPDLRSWRWYVPIITEFVARRDAVPAPPPPKTEDWPRRLAVWREDKTWAAAWGPPPGERGCRVPADLLREQAA